MWGSTMIASFGYAAHGPQTPLTPFTFERREPREHDVMIEILYCGVCHSDIHQVRDEWGGAIYPMVPGQTREQKGFGDPRALLLPRRQDRH